MKITIRFKLLLGLFVIFSIAFLILNFSIKNQIDKNNENIITQELITIKENCNVFIRQGFMINNYNNTKIYFEKSAKDISEELVTVINADIGVYSLNGELIYSSNRKKFTDSKLEDINNAINSKTSYTIKHNQDTTEIYFSYPVIISGNKVGILRIIKDYSILYNQGYNIIKFVLYATIVIFAVAFLFSYLLSKHITVPLLKLTKASTEAARGNLDIDIDINRKDEIGELSSNFSIMIRKINEQINTIKKDKDDLKHLINHKKYFYDNVTHELKTPLTSILGYTQMIKENGFTDKDFFDKGTDHIINESKRLHDMVLGLLEISKQTSDTKEDFSKIEIGNLLKNICEDMFFKSQMYENNIVYEFGKNIHVYGNSNQLKQVFINIIDNAIKYGFPKSDIKVISHIDNKFVYIDVINRGHGISSDEIDKIFTPFYRTYEQRTKEIGSCGLGLTISLEIIKRHKGDIKVQSAINKETSVSVKLPLYNLRI
ncbi:HAMP domain-containing sensor histidine kinase [Tissierella sp. MB52-C2]|uniref:HAMP domain-containing sensor histidine kinase n=1 Tax=Tissierella sp. MB52-C2 TaxID=3070999 RepID=UPI00280AD97E|nr:HAMP domain-containing sensor histidine kinase [Tissierella sp. MB52-C2]WMM23395.1 HAMP domain-containing sensor histidine kinase [Tissierella sp. MB52-C2]